MYKRHCAVELNIQISFSKCRFSRFPFEFQNLIFILYSVLYWPNFCFISKAALSAGVHWVLHAAGIRNKTKSTHVLITTGCTVFSHWVQEKCPARTRHGSVRTQHAQYAALDVKLTRVSDNVSFYLYRWEGDGPRSCLGKWSCILWISVCFFLGRLLVQYQEIYFWVFVVVFCTHKHTHTCTLYLHVNARFTVFRNKSPQCERTILHFSVHTELWCNIILWEKKI